MTREETQKLKALYVAMSAYYGQRLPDDALGLYVEDLSDLEYESVAGALTELRRDPRINRCPLPAVVRDRIQPAGNPAAEAIVAANEIASAIARIGPYRSPGLSALAMDVIRLEGGWEQVCEVTTNDNLPTLKAQWRELARSMIETGRSSRPGREQIEQRAGGDTGRLLNFLKPMPKGDE